MTFYLTTSQYNGIAALSDTVGSLSLSWLNFIQFYGNVTVTANDLLALQQEQNQFQTILNIPAFQWAQAIPLIAKGIKSKSLTLGVITGTFKIGETVTQATSGATGIVYTVTSNGDGTWTMVVNGVTGTFDNTHVITGGTSGATSTPSANGNSPYVSAFTNLSYIFGANISGNETEANPFNIILQPNFGFSYPDPIAQNTNISAVFTNLRASTSTAFVLGLVGGAIINTQNITPDVNGMAVITFNTGVIAPGAEIYVQVTQQVADNTAPMRGVINMVRTLYIGTN